MFTRALIAFLALPGMVAFVIPAAWLWRTHRTQLAQPLGLVLLALGVAALLWCVRDFYVSGKGPSLPGRHQRSWLPSGCIATVAIQCTCQLP